MADELADLDALLARLARSPLLADCDVELKNIAEPAPVEATSAVAKALAAPIGTRRLSELAAGKGSAVIVTSDATRAVPNRDLLPSVVAELHRAGIGDEKITVVIGTGAHRPATAAEVRAMLGTEWTSRLAIVNHDAHADDLVTVGRTSRGTTLLVNRHVAEADVRVALGVVEPHEFAGFTGGPKALLPAVAGYETIVASHAVDLLAHPAARPGVLSGNPIHEEMCSAAKLAGLHFVVNVVLDRILRPLAVAAGDPVAAQAKLVRFLESYARVELDREEPDLVVTGPGQPPDINLYQSVKALVALEPVVDRDTSVVLLSRCYDGVGSREMLEPFAADNADADDEGTCDAGGDNAGGDDARADDAGTAAPAGRGLAAARDVSQTMRRLSDGYTVEKDHSYFIARFLSRCPHVVARCPGVADGDLRRLTWEPASDADDALARAQHALVTCRIASPAIALERPPARPSSPSRA